MANNHKNFAETTLAAAITDTSGTSITVTSSASFPAAPFIIGIDTECLLVTNVSGTTWTVTRGYESSTAATHDNGTSIYHDISAGEVDSIDTKLAKAGGTMTGAINMGNQDIAYLKLLQLNGEIDDGNSGTAKTIDWNAGTAHKTTLTGNVTLAFTGYGPDRCSGGTITASDYMNESFLPSYGADDNNGTAWVSNTMPAWWKYQLAAAKTVTTYSLRTYYDSANFLLCDWTLQGSNNGTDWTTIDTVTGGFGSGENNTKKYFVVDSPGSYLYYKIVITAATGGATTRVAITEIELIDSGVSDPSAPCFLALKLVQDATGGRVVTWPATVKGSPVINQAANSVSNVLFYWDGTNYYTLNGLPWVAAPAAANSAGFAGQMAWDTSY
ncbi:MAG TPA: discoidin domain-containing protein, partial [Candidatus Cryosericum sp.]|nr:discoidin domain-containing protein [Candidatus Cryosericum sp.]